jgi:sugar phosphate isomerase/epimerase
MPKRLSFQLYSARNFGPSESQFATLAKIGYREVEGFFSLYDRPKEVRKALDDNGLTMPTAHMMFDDKDFAKTMDIAATLGVRSIYAPYIFPDDRPKDAAGWTAYGKKLGDMGQRVRAEGIAFGYHNHDFEFVKLPSGEVPFDLMYAAAPMLDMELDVAWVVKGAADPLAVIARYADRITSAHVKDIAPAGTATDEDGWADVGHGTMDWKAIAAALGKTRCLHYVMEHDNPKDFNRFAERSFEFASKI